MGINQRAISRARGAQVQYQAMYLFYLQAYMHSMHLNIPACCDRAATVLLARELQPEGFIVVPITPGWVATDLGNGTVRAPLLSSC